MQATNSEFQYILERDATFRYQFLDRLRLDCRCYLTIRYWKDLWAGNVEDQIDLMRDIYKSFDEKPEWTSMEEIDDLAKQMGYKTNKNLYIMTTTELLKEVSLRYPKLVVDEVFVERYNEQTGVLNVREDTPIDKDNLVDDFRKWMVDNGYWMEVAEPDNVFHIKRSELPTLCAEYHCNEDEVEDIFWYTKGVQLIIDEDTTFHITRDDLIVVWQRKTYMVQADNLDEAVTKVLNGEVTAEAEALITSPTYSLPKEGETYSPTIVISETGKEDKHIVEL